MVTLVVQFHPLEDSYSAALLEVIVEVFDAAAHPHEVVRMGQGEEIDSGRLALCRNLIVVAPTWWGAMPAGLLAWVQDELGPWIDGDADPARSPLRSVERLMVVTSHGSSRLVNRLQGEPGLKLWRGTLLGLCAAGARFDWIALYKLDRLGLGQRRAFLDRVAREVRSLSVA